MGLEKAILAKKGISTALQGRKGDRCFLPQSWRMQLVLG